GSGRRARHRSGPPRTGRNPARPARDRCCGAESPGRGPGSSTAARGSSSSQPPGFFGQQPQLALQRPDLAALVGRYRCQLVGPGAGFRHHLHSFFQGCLIVTDSSASDSCCDARRTCSTSHGEGFGAAIIDSHASLSFVRCSTVLVMPTPSSTTTGKVSRPRIYDPNSSSMIVVLPLSDSVHCHQSLSFSNSIVRYSLAISARVGTGRLRNMPPRSSHSPTV